MEKIEAVQNDLSSLSDRILYHLSRKKTKLLFLKGNLGAGKTTLVKAIVSLLGGDENEVDSPTFSIVNTYKFDQTTVHHFDLYRLESMEEVEDMGLIDYLESGDYCFIEWPEKIAEFFPEEEVVTVNISVPSDGCREYSIS